MISIDPTDEWSDYVANGQAFATRSFVASGLGFFGHIQLYNPVGSGVRLRLRFVEGLALFGGAVNLNVCRYDTPCVDVAPPPFGPMNLLGGGPANVAQIRTEITVAPIQLGTAFWLLLGPTLSMPAYPGPPDDWGHDILPGQGVMLRGGFIPFAQFQWAEVPL